MTHYPVLLRITKDGMKSKKGVYVGGYTIALFCCTSALDPLSVVVLLHLVPFWAETLEKYGGPFLVTFTLSFIFGSCLVGK